MKNARDFYYDYYNSDDKHITIQSKIDFSRLSDLHPAFKDSEKFSELKDFKPLYSNDFRMEKLFREVLNGCNDIIRSELENVFVVTHFDANFQAFINENPGSYEGSIIFLNLGLTSALIEYSMLFAQFSEYIFDKHTQNDKLRNSIIDSARQIAESQKSWRNAGLYNMSSFSSTFYNIPIKIIHDHVAPYISTIKFILCHEIAHSALGHFYKRDSFCSEYFGITFSDILRSPKNHQTEFHADIFSLLLSAGLYKHTNNKMPSEFKFQLEQAIGALLFFTVLGQQTVDTSKNSESHPSLDHRFGIMINSLKLFMDNDIFIPVASIIFEFQALLYRTQNVGLGKHVPSDYNILKL